MPFFFRRGSKYIGHVSSAQIRNNNTVQAWQRQWFTWWRPEAKNVTEKRSRRYLCLVVRLVATCGPYHRSQTCVWTLIIPFCCWTIDHYVMATWLKTNLLIFYRHNLLSLFPFILSSPFIHKSLFSSLVIVLVQSIAPVSVINPVCSPGFRNINSVQVTRNWAKGLCLRLVM